jgi:hypothetical protein
MSVPWQLSQNLCGIPVSFGSFLRPQPILR